MTTHILRHGQTDYSKRYLINGDPAQCIRLNEEGRSSLSGAWSVLPLHSVTTWLTSEFPRARQTASLLMAVPSAALVIDARLNELDYGVFEGKSFLEYASWLDKHGSSQRPPGAAESQREGIRRMLTGVLAAVEHPGPRVLVGHGLLVSFLLWDRHRTGNEAMPLFFPEAPYLEPVAISDDELPILITALMDDLDSGNLREATGGSDASILRVSEGPAVATVDPVSPSHPPDQKDLPHA
ncbi:histidine phosphatase family protein [Streptomyces sp. MCA2]|uniref:histidine phosphatase family protein n=1 Tax=Streptomyces sp. MCA2 TaxID=2944805 RepID=UPI0020222BA8|nr:histidine phosphatase family protein [Streptomyces sp. MCA2]MCL7492841.1 histidine phosphatase family protein [Streptomyces sp. MCA2]